MEKNKIKWWHMVIITCSIVVGLWLLFIRQTNWDEMHYVDPGAQLALQGRMVSNVWVSNSPNELWASSNPGMPLLFAGWFKIFGFGFIQSRTLFFLLHISGVYVFFSWIRNKFNPSAWALVLGISGAFFIPSLAEPIIIFRLEVLAFLLFTLFLYYTWTEKQNPFLNWIAPILLGLITVFFGFHFTAFFSLAACVALLLKRDRITLLRSFALAMGIMGGLVILWVVYRQLNMWDTLLAARTSHMGKQLSWCPIGWKKLVVTQDWALLLSLAIIGFIGNFKSGKSKWLAWALAISAFFIIPYIISSVGLYYRSYIWMVSLPMILCFYYSENSLKGWYLNFSIILISVSFMFYGIYSINMIKKLNTDRKQQNQLLDFINERIPKGSSIVAPPSYFYYYLTDNDFKYYPRRGVGSGEHLGYKEDYFFPKNLRHQVKFIITQTGVDYSEEKAFDFSDMGGEWKQIGNFPAQTSGYHRSSFKVFTREE
jgi:hypothetical protein